MEMDFVHEESGFYLEHDREAWRGLSKGVAEADLHFQNDSLAVVRGPNQKRAR